MDDKAWDKFAALELKLWKKSVNHLKTKLPDPLTHTTRISRSVLASLYKSLPPTITMWQFIEDVIVESKKAKFMGTFRDVDPSSRVDADGSLGLGASRREETGGGFVSPSTPLSAGELFSTPTSTSYFEGFEAGGWTGLRRLQRLC